MALKRAASFLAAGTISPSLSSSTNIFTRNLHVSNPQIKIWKLCLNSFYSFYLISFFFISCFSLFYVQLSNHSLFLALKHWSGICQSYCLFSLPCMQQQWIVIHPWSHSRDSTPAPRFFFLQKYLLKLYKLYFILYRKK